MLTCKQKFQLDTQGYLLFPKYLSSTKMAKFRSCFVKNENINYSKLTINVQYLLRNINTNINKKLKSTKYRASSSRGLRTSNARDASLFHRDCFLGTKFHEVFTILVYLDDGITELIPQTHRARTMDICSIVKFWKKRISIHASPGDMLIFHASTLHRGCYNNNKSLRRLIQIFDCHESNVISNKIHNIKACAQSSFIGDISEKLQNKFTSIFFGLYLNLYNDRWGNIRSNIQSIKVHPDSILSLEGTQMRTNHIDEIQKENLWHILIQTNDFKCSQNEEIMHLDKKKGFIFVFSLILCCFVLLIILKYIHIANKHFAFIFVFVFISIII